MEQHHTARVGLQDLTKLLSGWMRIRAEGRPPTTAATPDLTMRIVASLPHSISYATNAMLRPKIKVISVDGKATTDAAYALKR